MVDTIGWNRGEYYDGTKKLDLKRGCGALVGIKHCLANHNCG
jgi:hypothetical protein